MTEAIERPVPAGAFATIAPTAIPAGPKIQAVARENGALRRQLSILRENEQLKAELAARGLAVPTLRPTMRAIAEEVALKHDVSVSALVGPGRTREVVLARQEAQWLCRQVSDRAGRPVWSLPRIGRFFNRDHSSVLAALRRHANILAAADG